jgi:hypothetical protein
MSERSKNNRKKPDEFLQYRRKKMSEKEMNDFERHLQKDPFTEEAAEGFREVDPRLARLDLKLLSNKIRRRSSGTKFQWYRMAASVAVLMILVSVIVVVRKKVPDEIAYAPVERRVEQIKTEPEEKSAKSAREATEPVRRDKPGVKADEFRSKEAGKTISEEIIEAEPEKDKKKLIQVPVETPKMALEPSPVLVSENEQANARALVKEAAAKSPLVKGRIISSEDNLPVPGASIIVKGTGRGTITDSGGNFSLPVNNVKDRTLVASMIGMESKEFKVAGDTTFELKLEPSSSALDEIVVVGYGREKKEAQEEEYIHNPPAPVVGKAEFDKYIRENIRRPDTTTAGQRVVVVLNFIVRNNGILDSIKVVRSPGKSFSDEAVRLLKEGPAWKPATENGSPFDDEVRLRIVFR